MKKNGKNNYDIVVLLLERGYMIKEEEKNKATRQKV